MNIFKITSVLLFFLTLQIFHSFTIAKRQTGVTSKRKCQEYSSFVKSRVRAPTLLIEEKFDEVDECGHKTVELIIGGEEAKTKEFPHMAAIGYEASDKFLCGGTIISERYVLTAAHCLEHLEHGKAVRVKLGMTDLIEEKRGRIIKIAERIPHPKYNFTSYYHDIALLRLEKNITLNPYAVPACLYTKDTILSEKTIATGWGLTSDNNPSNKLMKVTLNLLKDDQCIDSYKNPNRKFISGILKDIQLCARGDDINGMKDTCEGDSGGPIQIYHTGDDVYCMYDIIGITSFSSSNCVVAATGVYVRVSQYIKWIEDTVWPEN